MRTNTVFLLICLSACLTQATTASPSQNELMSINIIDSLITPVKVLIENLKASIEHLVKGVEMVLADLEAQIKIYADTILDDFRTEVDYLFDTVKLILNEVEQKGTELGVDVVQCLASVTSSIDNTLNELAIKQVTCLNDNLKEAFELINKVRNILDNAILAAQNFNMELNKCVLRFSVSCLLQLPENILKKEAALRTEVSNQINNAINFVYDFQNRAITCTQDSLKQAAQGHKEFIDVINKCAADIFKL